MVGTIRPWYFVNSFKVSSSCRVSLRTGRKNSEAARKSMASEFNSGIGCSSRDDTWLNRRISSIRTRSARGFVEPTRTKTPSSGPNRLRW